LPSGATPKLTTTIPSSLDAKVDSPQSNPKVFRGARAWWRTLQICRVLGGLGFYIFLENYESRAKYNRRISARLREEAQARGSIAGFQEWTRELDRRALDK
jgi:hypothetical protein